MPRYTRPALVGLATATAAALCGLPALNANAAEGRPSASKHVLLISIDGMHQSDLDWYIANHPGSTLARLTHTGSEYTNAETSNPSDSDPGGTALMTGGNPRSTGVYYDVEYSHKTDEPGAACTPGRPATGGDVIYDSPDDALANVNDFINPANGTFPSFDENGSVYAQGVDTNPAAIMNLKFDPKTSLNPKTFPVDPKTCKPITPWDYLGDNTIFQVIHNAGLRTAWSDKHEVYASFNGPGSNGQSIDDLFSPEIDSQAVMPNGVPYPQDDDWAHIDAATKQYDGYKVQAVLDEIGGRDHSGKTKVGTPAIFGMNFQTVSVAQKIRSTPTTLIGPDAHGNYTTSAPEAGGYQWVHGKLVPGPVLSSALDYVNAQLGRMVRAIHKDGLAGSTTIIVTAKHGQSPQDPNKLVTVQDGPIVSAINAAWAKTHPSNKSLIVAGTDDDLWQSYLSDNSQAASDFVKRYLWDHTAQGYDVNKKPVTVKHSGLAQIWAGAAAAHFFGVPVNNGHYPDVFGEVQQGIVYAKPTKLAEHGGMNTGDRHVLMIVDGPGIPAQVESASVETTQVAPTILSVLGLNPHELTAVKVEHTKVLPGLAGRRWDQ
ncbi:alkaline phosphatase family protein [Streptacidiphilus jiangxiensis]|uniref:Type I phosphodiesterase / nucleotide pyrophosphatase n=1 Tax=Streptacidiphilus jiangxiensis TaxID=235985 RepID=A0A1H7ZUG4_STRJI|nr:alkaline phosphatase family protein [Streptacidiphilus jiangxiensis]SEM61941.1 Type I phosphodiesterase / nucleotide pyrophosphatase [Streptacidiphilus jiangxiensis]